MTDREWRAVLNRYGQQVLLYPKQGDGAVPARAFVQPVRERGEVQKTSSPLGLRREDRFVYLGAGEIPLTARESLVEWRGRMLEVQSAHPVEAGEVCRHWWAVLRPRDGEAV